MSQAIEAIPAATLILMRPGAGAPELLVMERAANLAFAPGALVFPGGRIEQDDHRLAQWIGPHFEHAAARVAAVRETIEEAGIAAGFRQRLDPVIVAEMRTRLGAGEAFSQILAGLRLSLDFEALTPFARWCPNFRETRSFDTFFFIAEAPQGAVEASADQAEAVRTFWAPAGEILEQAEKGEARLIFPTRRNLERLAQFGSIADARIDAALHPLQTVTPWVEEREGRQWLCIAEAIGYPITAELLDTARRG